MIFNGIIELRKHVWIVKREVADARRIDWTAEGK
jgi:hypothetical protein